MNLLSPFKVNTSNFFITRDETVQYVLDAILQKILSSNICMFDYQ